MKGPGTNGLAVPGLGLLAAAALAAGLRACLHGRALGCLDPRVVAAAAPM